MSASGTLKPFVSVESLCHHDLLLTRNPADRETYFRRSPCLLIEALLEPLRINRCKKLFAYQTPPSLEAYLLVEQDARGVEMYRRGNDWHVECIEHGGIPLPCLNTELAVADIYAGIR